MKRKIFSTLLMGAFFIASMSMFTSCKDYNDDINANSDEIAALKTQLSTLDAALKQAQADATTAHAAFATKSQIADLEKEIANLVKAADLQKAIDDVQSKLSGGSDKTIADLAKEIDAIDSQLNELGTTSLKDLKDAVETATKNITSQQAALDQLTEALKGKADTANVNEKIAALQKELENVKASAGDVKSIQELKDSMQNLNKKVDAFSTQINILTVLIKKQLTSLVFKPAYMWDGIESAQVPSVIGAPIYVFPADKDGQKKGEDTEVLEPKKANGQLVTTAIEGYGIAQYHYNPSTADLTKTSFSFLTNQPVNLSRATAADFVVNPVSSTVDGTNTFVENGVLNVKFTTNTAAIDAVVKDGKLPMAALQGAVSDTAVVSDYALILPTSYKDLVLGDNAFGENHEGNSEIHLYQSISDLKADQGHVHEVAYNSSIDLKEWIETHATLTKSAGENVENAECKKLDKGTLEALGLTYKFAAIEYETTAGNSDTKQSVHAQVTEDGIVTPKKVVDGKQTSEAATRAAIGKEPIVRVTLVDKAGNIYAYGYVKIKIVDATKEQNDKYAFTFNKALVANCDGSATALTWEQVETTLYNDLNMSKDEFESEYTLDTQNQYTKTSNGYVSIADYNKAVVAEAQKKGLDHEVLKKYLKANLLPQYGAVTKQTDDPSSATELLKWTLSGADQKALIAKGYAGTDGYSVKELTTVVKLAARTAKNPDLYIKLTIPVKGIKFAAGAIGEKLTGYWYTADASVNAEGASQEIRANVPVPEDASASGSATTFDYDILKTFKDAKLALSGVDTNKEFTSFANYTDGAKFQFVAPKSATTLEINGQDVENVWTVAGITGAKYVLKVSNDNKTINIVGVWSSKDKKYISTLNNGKADVEAPIEVVTLTGANQNVASYNVNGKGYSFTTDILNYKSHSELKADETFTAYVTIQFAEKCYAPILSGTDEFAVRFLRPVNFTANGTKSVKDAVDGGENVNLLDITKITDWRDYDFNTKPAYYSYYGVNVAADLANAYTDIQKSDAERQTTLTSVAEIESLLKVQSATSIVLTNEFVSGVKLEDGKWVYTYAEGAPTASPVYVKAGTAEKSTAKNPSPAYFMNAPVVNYKNNTSTVKFFHIYVPLTMTYNYGKGIAVQKAYGVITVDNTVSNAK